MAKLDVFDIVGNGVEALRLFHHLLSRHKHELRVLVDELPDKPRACDAIDLDLFAGDPFHIESPVQFGADIRCLKGRGFRCVRVKSRKAGPAPPAPWYERPRRSPFASYVRFADRWSRQARASRWRREPGRLPG